MSDRPTVLLGAIFALAVAVASGADQTPVPPPDDGVGIMFLPPPMEGTISVGVYDRAGKLVRMLHREAGTQDFKVGENGLITHWDGKDDSGRRAAPATYTVKGWMVGDLAVEGVAFHGNDWIKDDSPRYTRVASVKNAGRDEVRVTLSTVEGKEETLAWKLNRDGMDPPKPAIEVRIEEGRLLIGGGDAWHPAPVGDGDRVIEAVVGFGDHVWAIVESDGAREIRAYSKDGEFLRRLAYQKNEPQPRQIAASLWEEMIFLLDENETEQRLRALVLGTAPAPESAPPGQVAVSTWKITYLKRVLKLDSFEAVAGSLGRAEPLKAEAVAKVPVRANPLLGGKATDATVKVGIEPGGAVLMTGDGLPLAGLTTTRNLKWVALVREGDAFLLFQADGSVVEEFKIGAPGNMMSFDAGEFELRAPGVKLAPRRKKPLRPGDDL